MNPFSKIVESVAAGHEPAATPVHVPGVQANAIHQPQPVANSAPPAQGGFGAMLQRTAQSRGVAVVESAAFGGATAPQPTQPEPAAVQQVVSEVATPVQLAPPVLSGTAVSTISEFTFSKLDNTNAVASALTEAAEAIKKAHSLIAESYNATGDENSKRALSKQAAHLEQLWAGVRFTQSMGNK